MQTNSLPIVGWILLVAGLAIIFYSIYFGYMVFTAKITAPDVFPQSMFAEWDKAKLAAQQNLGQTPQEQAQKAFVEALSLMLPDVAISRILNLIGLSIFLGIFLFAGSTVSRLGLRILRTCRCGCKECTDKNCNCQ